MIELDYAKLAATPVATDPFPHVVVPAFVPPASLDAVLADLPPLGKRGSFPVDAVRLGPDAKALMAAMEGPELRAAIERLFGLDLHDAPTMVTLRGWTSDRDGRIHCDSLAKRVTVLLYLNRQTDAWSRQEGCLRLLRGPNDLEDFAVEVPPVNGTLLMFPERPDDLAWPPAVRRAALQRAAQLHDDRRQGPQRDAPAPDFRVREAADARGLRWCARAALSRATPLCSTAASGLPRAAATAASTA